MWISKTPQILLLLHDHSGHWRRHSWCLRNHSCMQCKPSDGRRTLIEFSRSNRKPIGMSIIWSISCLDWVITPGEPITILYSLLWFKQATLSFTIFPLIVCNHFYRCRFHLSRYMHIWVDSYYTKSELQFTKLLKKGTCLATQRNFKCFKTF